MIKAGLVLITGLGNYFRSRTTHSNYTMVGTNNAQFIRPIIQNQLFRVAPLPQEENNKILSAIAGFNDDTIPTIFCCLISKLIMDNPVYDPAYPQYKFDKKNIERWLKNGREVHPYTNTPLTKNQLVSDIYLKTRIQAFVSLAKKQAKNETFCGMRPGFLN